jgi:hypothetical protein
MKTVFADTLFWVARIRPNDYWANAAKQAEEELRKKKETSKNTFSPDKGNHIRQDFFVD